MDKRERLEGIWRELRKMQRTMESVRTTIANTPRMAHLADEVEKIETAIRRTMAGVEGGE